jgi:uncharacterized protein YegL
MTNEKLVEIVCVIDNSGSMQTIRDDAIGNFNAFLKEQQELETDIDAKFTMILFNTDYTVIHDGKPIKDVPTLNNETYRTMGCTALYDAVGKAIDTVGARLSGMAEKDRPSKVIVSILTDGQENSSREYNNAQIKDMIHRQENLCNWEFFYLSAGPDAFNDALQMGISSQNTMSFDASQGTRSAYASMSTSYCSSRTPGRKP